MKGVASLAIIPAAFILFFAAAGLTSCCKEAPLFHAMSTAVTFSNDLLEAEAFNIIDYLYFYNGGGVALGDINKDGLIDIYLTANQGENKMYLNKGNWEFEDITLQAGLASPGAWKTGVSMVDINGDGLLDIYQCRLGNYKGIRGKNQLFINQGNLTFTEEAAAYGIDFSGFSTHSAFFDYDLDGDLDMYLLNHSVHTEKRIEEAYRRQYDDAQAGDRLYENQQGVFRSVTAEAGIYSSRLGYGLGIGIGDLNGDGWPDIYVSNDFSENDYLYLNNKKKGFEEVIAKSCGHTSRFSMGNDIADLNHDGQMDILSLDMLPMEEKVVKQSAGEDSYNTYKLKLSLGFGRQFSRNALQLNRGNDETGIPRFSEIAQLAGVAATDWSWATLLADFDNDGRKDIFISNGIFRRPNDMDYIQFLSGEGMAAGLAEKKDAALYSRMPEGSVRDCFFQNKGDLHFLDVSTAWGMTKSTLSNGAAYADLDQDGDLDLVINHIGEKASLLRNDSQRKNQAAFLHIQLTGLGQNTQGIGAKVMAYAKDLHITQENYTSRGFQSSVPPGIHLGLGMHTQLDSLRISWPGGRTQLLEKVGLSKILQVREADAQHIEYLPSNIPEIPVLKKVADIGHQHRKSRFNDFDYDFLLPRQYATPGPALAVADVNADGRDDFFSTGSGGKPGALFLQTTKGEFLRREISAPFSTGEESAAHFFDANGDGYPDLYLGYGGSEWEAGDARLRDKLFLNDGKGNFREATDKLPALSLPTRALASADFDRDGDLDLFVGIHFLKGKYGTPPKSHILRNDGKGLFSLLQSGPVFSGMITSAQWGDLDADGWPDLVLAGEWMAPTIYRNNKGFLKKMQVPSLDSLQGWWHSLALTDLDGDGDEDLVIGNQGMNTRHCPSPAYPLALYIADFDRNGKQDPLLAYHTPDGIYPIPLRDELLRQIPGFKKQFVRHRDYAGKTIDRLIDRKMLDNCRVLTAGFFSSIAVENLGNFQFSWKKLPREAQFSPIHAICAIDLDADARPDLVTGGNQFDSAPYFGTYDADLGLVMRGSPGFLFQTMTPQESGLRIQGQIRAIQALSIQGNMHLLLAVVDNKPVLYRVMSQKMRL